MKLLELTRSYYPSVGGFEKSIVDRVKIYDALGIQYTIVTTDFYNRLRGNERLLNVIYLKQYTPYNITPRLFNYLRPDYDLVSINLLGRYYSDAAIHYFSHKRMKMVLTPYSVYHTNKYSFIKRVMQAKVFPYLLNKVDTIVALTETEKRMWVSDYGISPERIIVIPPYVTIPPEKYFSAEDKTDNYLLYLGRNDSNKRVDLLLKAYCAMPDQKYSLYLTVSAEELEQSLYKTIQHDRRIKLLGYVDEEYKSTLMQHAAAVVFPTSWEAFGYVAFEASGYAKPLLCSDLPIFRELLDGNGVIYFQNTVDSLIAAFRKFIPLTEKEKQVMGLANYYHLSNFSFEQAKLHYQKLFERLQKTDFTVRK